MDWKLFLYAVLVNLGLAGISYAAGAVSVSGVVGGFAVGFAILFCGGWGSFGLLVTFFVFGSLATKLGYRKKESMGVAQEGKGRRGARHAFANCGVPAAAAVVYMWGGKEAVWPLVVLAGAFGTAIFDTVSSEIGQLYGKRPFLITTLRSVPVGTDGAVSLEGTLAGLLAAAFLASVGWALGMYGPLGIVFVAGGAFIGTTFESIIGAAGSAKERINNELLNFLNTVVGGACAGLGAFFFLK